MDVSFVGLRIAGIASAVPAHISSLMDEDFLSLEEKKKIIASTGISQRHTSATLCTSDLCYAAARNLFEHLKLSSDAIDVLIFVSQTPDYLLPATSCSLQKRLGLSKKCASFDVNLGCSGYVYALWLASNLLNNPSTQRVLLLVGDTISRIVSPQDRSVAPLFGDAGTATLIERSTDKVTPWYFSLGTDGEGEQNLIVQEGGFRNPLKTKNKVQTIEENDTNSSYSDLYMNGGEIFAFTLQEVPKLVANVLDQARWSLSDVDAFIFHQANYFMLEHLRKRIGIPKERFMMALEKFGNTSSASIPLTISSQFSSHFIENDRQLLLVGFGVGYSWGATALQFDKEICLPPISFVP